MLNLLLIVHLVVIATGTGMAFTSYIAIRIAANETGERKEAFIHFRRIMGQFGNVILALVWISGLSLAWTYKSLGAPEMTSWFYIKIGFVIVLTASHIGSRMIGNAMVRQEGDEEKLQGRMELLVSLTWASAVFAIILAVVAFEKAI